MEVGFFNNHGKLSFSPFFMFFVNYDVFCFVVDLVGVVLLGDLYEDGKVIHRPQYRYNERQQQTRNRPRPRYDRRRETMQVEKRETVQGQNWTQYTRPPVMQPSSDNVQNSTQGGGGEVSMNQGQLNQST